MTTFCLFQSSVFEKFRSHSKSRWSTPEGYTNSQPAVHPPVTSVCNVISVACTACASITCRSVSIRVHMQCLWPGWIRRASPSGDRSVRTSKTLSCRRRERCAPMYGMERWPFRPRTTRSMHSPPRPMRERSAVHQKASDGAVGDGPAGGVHIWNRATGNCDGASLAESTKPEMG